MPVNEKHWMGGITGQRYEELDDLNPDRIDKNWPVDSDGNKLSLAPVYMETMDRAPTGVIKIIGGAAQPIDPAVSQAQNRAMHAAAEGHSTLGIPKSVGEDYVEATHGHKVSALPEHVRSK